MIISNKPAWIFLNILSCITMLNEYILLLVGSALVNLKNKFAKNLNFVSTLLTIFQLTCGLFVALNFIIHHYKNIV